MRDRAILLLGYTGALRRSELARVRLEDLEWVGEGALLNFPWSKTDQEGQGRKVAVPKGAHRATCPVTALKDWIAAAGITEGPVFREVDRHGRVRSVAIHRDTVGAIVKKVVGGAGFAPEGLAGHALRAGFATQAARNGAIAFDIMRQTGHRSITTVSRYVRDAQIFRGCARKQARALKRRTGAPVTTTNSYPYELWRAVLYRVLLTDRSLSIERFSECLQAFS